MRKSARAVGAPGRARPSKPSPATEQGQLDFNQASLSKPHSGRDPEQTAKASVSRRAKPSATSGHVKLTLTLDLPRELAERLSARAIREEKNLDGLVTDLLAKAAR